MKKKVLKFAVILIVAWLLLQFISIPAVVLPIGISTVTYRFGDVEFQENLTPDEVQSVIRVLRGKPKQNMLICGTPACGFSQDLSLQIGGVTYYLALDECGTVGIGNALFCIHYVDISDEERDALEEIFNSHGGKVPYL